MKDTCTCVMFKNKGYCYHTGYRPLPTLSPVVPLAVRRMERWVKEHPLKERKSR